MRSRIVAIGLAGAVGLAAVAGCDLGSDDADRPSRFGEPQLIVYMFDDEDEGRVGLSR